MREGPRRWLPVVLWIAVILTLGQGSFSADATRSRLEPLLRLLGFGPEAIETTHFLVRKGAHLTEYGVLGALAERALVEVAPGGRALRAGLLALAVAATDESLQSRLPERTGTPGTSRSTSRERRSGSRSRAGSGEARPRASSHRAPSRPPAS